MLALCYRFDSDKVSTLQNNQTQTITLGLLNLQQDGSLILDMNSGSSCGLGDDVYAFAADETGVWYITYQDYFKGNPWVYCVSFIDTRLFARGVIDENGTYLFSADNSLFSMNRQGKIHNICSLSSMSGLLEYDSDYMPLTISRINRYIASSIQDNSLNSDVFTDMLTLHRCVDWIACENDYERVSKNYLASIVIGTLTIANKAGINIQAEIIRQLKYNL